MTTRGNINDTSDLAKPISTATQAELDALDGRVTVLEGGPGPHILIEDQKAQNTPGGTFTSGADQTRALNTEAYDPNNWCTLSSNQFTLVAGTWAIRWRTPASQVDAHQSLLYNVTDAAVVARGSVAVADSGGTSSSESHGETVVTIAAPKAFEIRHRCTTSSSGDGFGVQGNFGTEVYTQVAITRRA